MKRAIYLGGVLVATAVMSAAQGSVKIVDGASNERIGASSGAGFAVMLTAIGTTTGFFTDGTTTLSGTNYDVQLLYCINTSAGTATITILDSAGHLYGAAALAPNSINGLYSSPLGIRVNGGLQLVASGTAAIACQAQGVRKGVPNI